MFRRLTPSAPVSVSLACLCLLSWFSTSDSVLAQDPAPEMKYPLGAVSLQDQLLVVDLDLPGVLVKKGPDQAVEVFRLGAKRFRQPLNRPRCIAVTAGGDVLVGDSASRDVYLVKPDADPKPLTESNVGIPMSLAIAGDQVYVADLETRFILRFPLAGGKPEVFAKVNTRGLFMAGDQLWCVTQEERQLVKIDPQGTIDPVVKERVFMFPHQVVVVPDGTAYVTDGYKKAIWKVPPGAAPEVLVEGEPLQNPVGLAIQGEQLLVADPHAKKVFRLNPADKQLVPVCP